MTKPPVKRKSETSWPTGKAKYRKIRATRQETSDSEEAETQSGQELFVPGPAQRAKWRKSEPVKATKVDEYDEDPGREESQKFLSLLGEFEGRKKKAAVKEVEVYIEKLTKSFGRDEEELKKQIEDLSTASMKKDVNFLGNFKRAYKAATPFQRGDKDSSERSGFATMYDRSNLLTKNAFGLITKFEEVSQYITELDTTALMDSEWGGEDEKLANLLLIGRDVGISRCQSILMTSSEETLSPEEMIKGEDFYTGEQTGLWGKIARKEEKAIKKLVRATVLEL